jgi:ribosome recycling factor
MDVNQDTKGKMEKVVAGLKAELSKLRTGRASASLVEHIRVDYYGTPTPISQVGQISIPDPKTIQISSWDQSAIPAIEKAIIAANIGLTPNVDGKLIRLNIPALTEERRKDIAKSVKKIGEESKVAIRNVRRDANEAVKAQEKGKALSEDQAEALQETIQKTTDNFVEEVDKIIDSKTKDVMTV